MAANVNNYISAGNAAVRKAVKIRKALADNKPRYGKMGEEAVTQAAKNVANVAQNNALMAQTSMDAKRSMYETDLKIKTEKAVANAKKGARKAGMLAGGVALLGAGAMQMNKKEEPNEMLATTQSMIDKLNNKIGDSETAINTAQSNLDALKNGDKPTTDTTDSTSSTTDSSQPTSTTKPDTETAPVPKGDVATTLGGSNSIFSQAADITGKYESDSSGGYNAYNLGGSKGGTVAHGSGNSADGKQFGGSLTSMSIGKIKQLQASGKLHAAGRFQFIGNSLPEAAQFAGLSDNDVFSPENQNKMFMAFGKKYGSGRWVGLDKATPEERAIVKQAFSQYQN